MFNDRRFGTGFDPNALIAGAGQDPEAIVDAVLDRLGPLEVGDEVRLTLVDYLTDGDLAAFRLDPRTLESKVRGLAHLAMSLPEYQLN